MATSCTDYDNMPGEIRQPVRPAPAGCQPGGRRTRPGGVPFRVGWRLRPAVLDWPAGSTRVIEMEARMGIIDVLLWLAILFFGFLLVIWLVTRVIRIIPNNRVG